jgi:EmrB/QacA subfamily drug resistance transporter
VNQTNGIPLDKRARAFVIAAALLALFLGALDALVMSAAMPTIVAKLGGLRLYSWVYTAYFLARAVSLPVFGKLADLYPTRRLFVISICIFLLSSIMAGCATGMGFLVAARVLQGIGAGGNFALVYIVLADISTPERRGKTLSLASSVWGVASVLGPSMGGFIVTYFSWRWIFFFNIPLALFSLAGIGRFLVEVREKRTGVRPDYLGIFFLAVSIISLLTAFMSGGRGGIWYSPGVLGLFASAAVSGGLFYFAEKRAADPVLSLSFFRVPAFSLGNLAVFFSSVAIFSLFAYAPLFIQGALGKSPMGVGSAMLAVSFGWSIGALLLGQVIHRIGLKPAAAAGGVFLIGGCGATVFFGVETTLTACFSAFLSAGVGMGFVTLSTLLIVQNSLSDRDLGVATSTHQFTRTMAGTIGIGVAGGFVTARLNAAVDRLSESNVVKNLPVETLRGIQQNAEILFQPETQAMLSEPVREALRGAVVEGVSMVFRIVTLVAVLCFITCLTLPKPAKPAVSPQKAGERKSKPFLKDDAKTESSP